MSAATPPSRTTPPPLVEGQRLDQPTFHERYEAMPPGTRTELIGGIVFMPGPVSYDHGDAFKRVIHWLDRFEEFTPGVHAISESTVILGWRNETQPDAGLRIRPEYGGRTRNEKGYIAGPPELVVEVARSSRYINLGPKFDNLGPKFDEYERAVVLEYVVRSVEPDEVLWHVLDGGRFVPLSPDADGLIRSRAFPGLWLDPVGLLAGDRTAVRDALDRGLATPEHAAFVARLEAARAGP